MTSADVSGSAGEIKIAFSDGTDFTVTPVWDEEDDAIENWELFTPDGRVLIYGPQGRWQIGSADDRC